MEGKLISEDEIGRLPGTDAAAGAPALLLGMSSSDMDRSEPGWDLRHGQKNYVFLVVANLKDMGVSHLIVGFGPCDARLKIAVD